MLKGLRGLWLRWYNRRVPSYSYNPSIEPQPDAREFPYSTLPTGATFQELNRTRTEHGDLPTDMDEELKRQGITTEQADDLTKQMINDGLGLLVGSTQGVGENGKLPGLDRLSPNE